MLYPVILAGGSGSRLWPVSTKHSPKQVRALIGSHTLLQETYQRLLKGFDADNIFVSTKEDLVDIILAQIPIDKEHLIIEPSSRSTAAAIGLAAINILRRDPEAHLVTINSDAYVRDIDNYLSSIKTAGQISQDNPSLMTLIGLRPTYPETGYGYIELGQEIKEGIFNVEKFKEKPNKLAAEHYLADKKHLWNPAIFIFKARQLLQWYREFLPAHAEILDKILSNDAKITSELADKFLQLEKISIDYGILEKLSHMLVLRADFDWIDIGNWQSLKKVLSADKVNEDISNSKTISLESQRNLLYSFNDKLIATIGIEDMILVETDEAILLCPASRAHEIKLLLEKMEDGELKKFL